MARALEAVGRQGDASTLRRPHDCPIERETCTPECRQSAANIRALTAEIDRMVLAGRPMQPALLLDVRRLPDAGDRMQALIYLRRSGLLTGQALSLDEMVFLRPATPPEAVTPVQHEDYADED